ncbi:MAG: hypothetical protein PHU08_05620, partial [Dehalococcoidales bacterium]|nr:hypothetical protein [Dehalococcoidales bacterium]
MKRIISIVALVVVLFAGFSLPVAAHAPNTELQPLAGQYSVVVETTHLGGNSWIFQYTITNLTEVGDYSDLGGLPEWANGIDHTGLDGFFV